MQGFWLGHISTRIRMRHLKHNITPPLAFIDQVIASKHLRGDDKKILAERERCTAAGMVPPADLTYKERCAAIRKRNKDEINKYEAAFKADDLAAVPQGVPVSLNGSGKDCEDMDELYTFGCEPLGKLWVEVLSSDGYLNDKCPVCEAIPANTFDHYLPQSAYQMFAVHPLNLIPCCTECNGHKLKNLFDKNGKRKFWNAYLDKETTEQYLFCDISEENGMPKATFRVEKGKLPERYFEIIKNSFEGQKIDKTYANASGGAIIRLKDSCCKFFSKNQDKGLDNTLQMVADMIPDTNINNWEYVLDKTLIGTDVFKRFVIAALKQEYGIIV